MHVARRRHQPRVANDRATGEVTDCGDRAPQHHRRAIVATVTLRPNGTSRTLGTDRTERPLRADRTHGTGRADLTLRAGDRGVRARRARVALLALRPNLALRSGDGGVRAGVTLLTLRTCRTDRTDAAVRTHRTLRPRRACEPLYALRTLRADRTDRTLRSTLPSGPLRAGRTLLALALPLQHVQTRPNRGMSALRVRAEGALRRHDRRAQLLVTARVRDRQRVQFVIRHRDREVVEASREVAHDAPPL